MVIFFTFSTNNLKTKSVVAKNPTIPSSDKRRMNILCTGCKRRIPFTVLGTSSPIDET